MYSNIFRPLLMLAILMSLLACSAEGSTEEEKETDNPEQAEDTYNYIALRSDGTLFTIGDHSGTVIQAGKIPGIEFNTFFNSVTSSNSKIFIYEHRFDPPRGILYVWDKQTNKTESAVLEYPEEFGENTALMSLDWDEENQNLVGITREDIENSSNYKPIKVVRINPVNLEMTISPDIDLFTEGYANVFSTSLVNQKLYAVTTKDSRWDPDLLEINLNQNSFKALPRTGAETGFSNLGNSGDANTIFGFSPVANSGYMAEARPVIYDIISGTFEELSEVPRISVLNFSHKTFYNEAGKEYAELVGSDGKIQLFKYQPEKRDYQLIEIPNPQNLSTLLTIIGVKEI